MSPIGIPPLQAPNPPRAPEKIRDAAQQFEALLIGQILHSARESDTSAAADSITDFAEQQLATIMSRSGGLGIADHIARGLAASSAKQPGGSSTEPPPPRSSP